MNDDVLTLAEAAKEVKVSEDALKRRARAGEGPFYKVCGRWRTYRGELHAWVRSQRPSVPQRNPEDRDPMPRPRKRGSVAEKVIELRARRAS
jgi:excisionase family DNA binding protein